MYFEFYFVSNTGEFDILRWKALINEIVEVSVLCDTFAVSIVSHSSPEGYLPADETLGTEKQTMDLLSAK